MNLDRMRSDARKKFEPAWPLAPVRPYLPMATGARLTTTFCPVCSRSRSYCICTPPTAACLTIDCMGPLARIAP